MLSLVAREHGAIGHATLLAINATNGALPLLIGLAVSAISAKTPR